MHLLLRSTLARRLCHREVKAESFGHESKYFLPTAILVSRLPSKDAVVKQLNVIRRPHTDILIHLVGVVSRDDEGAGPEFLALRDSCLVFAVFLSRSSPWSGLIFAVPDG